MKIANFDFRIWDNHHIGCSNRDCKCKITKYVYGEVAKIRLSEFKEDCEIELWTGLYDKNNKKIYDGDIVEVDSEPYNFIDSIYIDTIRGIEFENRTLYLTDVVSCFTHGDILEEIEVVGNIHENKDLKGFAKEIKKGDIFLCKGNEYIYLGEIINKTTDKQMVIYSANGVDYVREKEDFLSKFKPKDSK